MGGRDIKGKEDESREVSLALVLVSGGFCFGGGMRRKRRERMER